MLLKSALPVFVCAFLFFIFKTLQSSHLKIIRADIQPPVKISACKPQNKRFCGCNIRCNGDVVFVTTAGDRVNIRRIWTCLQRIVEEDDHIHTVSFDHINELLVAANASRKEFVNLQICNVFNSPSRSSCRIEPVL